MVVVVRLVKESDEGFYKRKHVKSNKDRGNTMLVANPIPLLRYLRAP